MKRTLVLILILNLGLFLIAILHEWTHYSSNFGASNIRKVQRGSTALGRPHAGNEATADIIPDQLRVAYINPRTPAPILEASAIAKKHSNTNNSSTVEGAIILFCYDRVDYLERTLVSLASLKGIDLFSVYISQDGSHPGVAALVERLGRTLFPLPKAREFVHWQHSRTPLLGPTQPGHAYLSQHYKWGLDRIFLEERHERVIILEDDMIFSPDFLTYFQATAALMQQDPTIWCASSWNDNGHASLQWDEKKLYRTSYFPGLGWMMRRELWLEIGIQFPKQAWDHWMRLNTTSKGRDCVVPEVSRNRNIGEIGANMNAQVFKKYLQNRAWAQEGVDDFGDLEYLTRANYEKRMKNLTEIAEVWSTGLKDAAFEPGKVYPVTYLVEEYEALVKPLKLWPFPRGHQKHLTRIPLQKGVQLLLADRRACPLLPTHLRVLPDPQLQPTVAERAANCSMTCRNVGKQCSESNFWFINSCEVLMQNFPCESGCAVELGSDIPNYVMDPNLSTFHSCLITQKQPECDASHAATARLCPCT